MLDSSKKIVELINESNAFKSAKAKSEFLASVLGLLNQEDQPKSTRKRPEIHRPRPETRKPSENGATVLTSAESAKADEASKNRPNRTVRRW